MALAGVPAVAMAYLAEEVHASSLGSAMGRYVAGTTVGGLIGRIVPSLVVDISNWRVALLASSVTTLAATVAFAVLVPRSRYFTPNPASTRATLHKLGGHLRNPVLFKLFILSFVLMGGFVSVYNYLGYRLTAQPFGLASSMVGLLFVLYLAGINGAVARRGLTINDYVLVIQAVMEGQGIALGWRHLTERLVASGLLMRITDHVMLPDASFHVAWPKNRELPDAAKRVRDWLAAQG